MSNKILLTIFSSLLLLCASAQQPGIRVLKVVDTLSAQEKLQRNPVILRSELDSIVQLQLALLPSQQPVTQIREVVKESTPSWLWVLVLAGLAGIGALLYRLYRNQQLALHKIEETHKLSTQSRLSTVSIKEPGSNGSIATGKKIQAVQAELDKLKKENKDLEDLIKQYDAVKKEMTGIYKIRNYPGYAATKSEEELLKGLLKTEKSVAMYSYEHFLKPIIAIADANKNNPLRTSKEDREKLMELLVSLSLLYIEYLYLRVNELSVGGNMIARIQGLSNGNRLDTVLMKELNTEHGSRALVLRMILDKLEISKLSYPVFDETNLNLS